MICFVRNAFLDKDNNFIRISDLGLAKSEHMIPLTAKHNGTLNYKSSQFIHREKYTDKHDIWSFGCVLYELIKLKKAYEGETVRDMMEVVLRNEIEPLDPNEPKEFEYILEKFGINYFY